MPGNGQSAWAPWMSLLKDGTVKATDKILIFNTGAAQKYPHSVNELLPYIDIRTTRELGRHPGREGSDSERASKPSVRPNETLKRRYPCG